MIDNRVPYFYIIRHIPSGKYYAGSKWGIDASPSNFMKTDGYTTSSRIINELIQMDGLSSFEILVLMNEEECGCTVLEYETGFLHKLNCGSSHYWFNGHNNEGISFGTPEFKYWMQYYYGVDSPSHCSSSVEKKKLTLIKKYGSDTPYAFGGERMAHIIKEKYGVDNASSLDSVKEKRKITLLLKCGEDNPAKLHDVQEKIKQTNKNKYGVEHFTQSEIYLEKVRLTSLKNYGVEHFASSSAVIEKRKNNFIHQHGVENPAQIKTECPHCKKMVSINTAKRYHFDNCVDNPYCTRIPVICPHCSFSGYNKSAMSRFHFDNCKRKP